MKWLLFVPVTLLGLTGCAVYTPVGHHGAVVVARPATVYVQPAPVYVYPSYRGGTRRDRDGDGVPGRRDRDRDGDGVPNRYDRQPDNPWRR